MEPEKIRHLIPGGGWCVFYLKGDDDFYAWPLVAWGVQDDMLVVPLESDSSGIVDVPCFRAGGGFIAVLPPGEKPSPEMMRYAREMRDKKK